MPSKPPGSLALRFDEIEEEDAKARVPLHAVPGPNRLRSMEISEMFSEIEELTRDNLPTLFDPGIPEGIFSPVAPHSGPEATHLTCWNAHPSKWQADPGEASWFDLESRLAYFKARSPKPLQSNFTWARWQRLLEGFDWECAYCGSSDDLEQDHMRPVQKGGSDLMDNILPSCHGCNSAKGIKLLEAWLRSRSKSFREGAKNRIEACLRKVGRRAPWHAQKHN